MGEKPREWLKEKPTEQPDMLSTRTRAGSSRLYSLSGSQITTVTNSGYPGISESVVRTPPGNQK